MGKKDSRVDAYISKSADFAKPVMKHLRQLIHANCPEVEETIKWRFPSFMHHGILCGLAAFKHHCTFGFWHRGMTGKLSENGKSGEAMGQLGRITSLSDLPRDAILARFIKEAAKLNESGVKAPAMPKSAKKKKALKIPAFFAKALKQNKKALTAFEAFSYSHKKEYVEWLSEAKRPETREKRLQTALEWLAEGKSRNWKYARC